MKKWIVGLCFWFGCVFGANSSDTPSQGGCDNPCPAENYNGLACCMMPCEFYFPKCDRPCGGDFNVRFVGTFGETIATTKNYVTLEAYARQFFTCYETYIDGKWHYLSNWKNAANVGLGIRTYDCYNIVGGANIYYDYRAGPCDLNFHQISGGFEVFHPCFSAYLNVYYPFEQKKCLNRNVFSYEGGYFACCQQNMCALAGFDMEIDKTCFYWKKARINAGIGAYFYDNKCDSDWLAGGRFRLVADFSTNVRVELETTYDSVFKSRTAGKISINIPFPISGLARKRSGCCESWCPPLPQRRNNLIVFDRQTCWNWNFDDSDGSFQSHRCFSGDANNFYDNGNLY